jgi:Leucine-rich repeat (LRR) protein
VFISSLSIDANGQEFTIAQNTTGNNRNDLRGQVFTPSQQEDGTGTITSSGVVYLKSFNIIYDAGEEAQTMFIYSTLPATTLTLDNGTGGVLVGQSTAKATGDFPYTNYSFDYLALDVNTNYYAVFKQDVQLEFGGSLDVEGPYAGGKMLKNDGVNVLENDFAALKFIGEFSNNPVPNQDDVAALTALYNATNGANWVNSWDLNGNPYDWFGVTWENGIAIELNLESNNLSGDFPSSIADLSSLKVLALSSNQLLGPLPVEIADMSSLTRLSINFNNLSGSILPEIGNLTNLEYLALGGNQLSGSIPSTIGNLSNLTGLILDDNMISETIPPEIGDLAALTELHLYANALTGIVPAEIGQLSNLNTLLLGDNQLSGSIPAEIGALTNLHTLVLSVNEFSGAIPVEIGGLTNLTTLNLQLNKLVGQIPSELGNLTLLTSLYLSYNELSGSIPTALGQLTNIFDFDLSNNDLEGEIPSELSQLTDMGYFGIGKNNLNGVIPSWLGNLTDLYAISLSNNNFEGSIPSELGNITGLLSLQLANNKLVGEIPVELTNIIDLHELSLNDNLFDFSSFEPIVDFLSNISELDLHPQSDVAVGSNVVFTTLGSQVTLTVETPGENNHYQWFQNEFVGQETTLTEVSSSPDYTISEIEDQDFLGTYYCKITNTLLPALTLRTENIVLAYSTEFTSPPSVIGQNAFSIALETTVNKDGMLYYLALPEGNPVPSQAQIISGVNALDEMVSNAGSIAVEKDLAIGVSINQLDMSTNYDLYFVIVGGQNVSQDLAILNVSTIAGVTFIDGSPKVVRIDATEIITSVQTTRDAAIYHIALEKGSTTPSAEQIIAGTNATDEVLDLKASIDILAETATEINISGLDDQTLYDIYVVAQDEEDLVTEVALLSIETITGLFENQFTEAELSVYPNPTKKALHIDLNTAATYDIEITNLKGQQVLEVKNKSKSTRVDVSTLQKGVYLIHIETSKKSGWMRFVKF